MSLFAQPSPKLSRWLMLWALLALAAPDIARAASAAVPGVLTLVQGNARVQWGGPGLGRNSLNDPWFIAGSAAGVAAETDLVAGTIKASSTDTSNPSGVLTYAYGNFEVLMQNTGPAAIAFAAGAISANINASFLRSLGPDAYGSASNLMTASLYGEGGGLNSAAGFTYRASAYNRAASPDLDFQLLPNAGFTAAGSADLASLAVTLAFPAFVLLPDQTLRMGLSLTTNAWGYEPGGGGWSATTDAFNTATIAMSLPPEVRLESAQPLGWVSSVPEPATAWSLLAGLACLAAGCSVRQRLSVR